MEAEKNELAREQVELADYARNLIAKFLQRQPDRKNNDESKQKPENEHQDNTKQIDPKD